MLVKLTVVGVSIHWITIRPLRGVMLVMRVELCVLVGPIVCLQRKGSGVFAISGIVNATHKTDNQVCHKGLGRSLRPGLFDISYVGTARDNPATCGIRLAGFYGIRGRYFS